MRGALTVTLALVLGGCLPTDFDELRADAPTRALAPPRGSTARGFGTVVAGYGGSVQGTRGTRAGSTAGGGSSYTVYPLLIDDEVRLDVPTVEGCTENAPCGTGSGVSLIGIPAWGERELCAAVASPDEGEIQLRCEDDVTRLTTIPGPRGVRFGTSAAALGVEHPFGRAVFGAPGGNAVYRLPDAQRPTPLDLSLANGVGTGLGTDVALTQIDDDSVLVVAGAPEGSTKRVVVARSDVAPDGTVATTVVGCLDASTVGWGAAVAAGDLDGDGRPEIAVGSADEEGRLDAVRVYAGSEMPDVETCDDTWVHAVELTCQDAEDVRCGDRSGYGSSLEVGDLDGDGSMELLVGAPGAEVRGVEGAGAVFALGGGELATLGERVVDMTLSNPGPEDRLGTAIAVAPGMDDRMEPVVGAPGANRAYVFLCSGLEGDSEATTPAALCQPR